MGGRRQKVKKKKVEEGRWKTKEERKGKKTKKQEKKKKNYLGKPEERKQYEVHLEFVVMKY